MPRPDSEPQIDPLLPPAAALRAEEIGIVKARMPFERLFMLAVLAGAFIALGAIASIVTSLGWTGYPAGIGRLLAGTAFSLGLILVIVGGAELFTGNNLLTMAWAGGKIGSLELIRNWTIVYIGNAIGAVGTALLVWLAGFHELSDGAAGELAVRIGELKVGLDPLEAVVRGILCNTLVCLAVWMCFGAQTIADRVLVIVPPIATFVAAGFEHSVANMFFLPYALFLAPAESPLTWSGAIVENLLPVTVGNIIGGGVLVGAVYWFVYLRVRHTENSQLP